VLTAHVACLARPDARRVLDLGCGIGSVLLSMADVLEAEELVGVEAQEVSYGLCLRNVERNGLGERVRVIHGDLRELVEGGALTHLARRPIGFTPARSGAGTAPQKPGFDLVTGTPPYQPPGTATPSPDPQRAHARIELRGGIEDYLRAAAAAVAEDGVVVVCGDARRPERVTETARSLGLHVRGWVDALPREGRAPLFSVWTLRFEAGDVARRSFVARDVDGARTEEYVALRRFFGLPKT